MREKPGVVVHTCRASYVEVKQGNQTPCWPGQKARPYFKDSISEKKELEVWLKQ
jgi:hypothetical protein